MLGQIAFAPEGAWCDCAATVADSQSRVRSTSARCAQAHMWSSVHAVFEDGLTVHKTRAHCSEADVARGRTSAWERKANAIADALAKRGAASHPSVEKAASEIAGLRLLCKELGQWVGRQGVLMRERGWVDSEGLPEKSHEAGAQQGAPRERPIPPVAVRFRAVLSAVAQSGPCDPELAVLMRLSQHNLRVCHVYDQTGASVVAAPRMICCLSCGAYAWGGVRELSDSVCHGHAAGSGLKQQRARLLAGLFPRWLTNPRGLVGRRSPFGPA